MVLGQLVHTSLGLCLICKVETMVEMFASAKRSSLLRRNVTYAQKRFLNSDEGLTKFERP
jgi:hypothetical protein